MQRRINASCELCEYIIKDFFLYEICRETVKNILLPSMNNTSETNVLSLSLIALSVGYSLEWNMDRRLKEEKWRFILDNSSLASYFSRLPACLSVCSSLSFSLPLSLSLTNTFRGPGNLFYHSLSLAGLYVAL